MNFEDLKYNDIFFQLQIEQFCDGIKRYNLKIFQVVSTHIGRTAYTDGILFINARQISPSKIPYYEYYAFQLNEKGDNKRIYKNDNVHTSILTSDKTFLLETLKELNNHNNIKIKEYSIETYKEICTNWKHTKEILTKGRYYISS